MTVFSPDSPVLEQGILLRELNHRINNGLASAINLISAAAVRAEGAEAKRALSDVVELLHGYADVQRALAMPEGEALVDAETYIRRLVVRHALRLAGSNEYRTGTRNRISPAPIGAMLAARIDRPRTRNPCRETCVFRRAGWSNQDQADTNRRPW